MAGANQLPKFLPVNRELQLSPLRTIGTEFHQRVVTTLTVQPLTAALFTTDLLFTAGTPNALAGPSAVQLCTYFQSQAPPTNQGLNPSAIGDSFQVMIQNTDPVFSKVVTFGLNVFPATLTIPPLTTDFVRYELTSLSPQTWTLLAQWPSVMAGGGAVSSFRQSAAAQAAPFFNLAPARIGGVVAQPFDYVATDVGFAANGLLATGTVQSAMLELDTEKVTLRDATGARTAAPGGATAATDILVATAAGDNYVPSRNVLPGRIGSIEAGVAAGGVATAQTSSGFAIEGFHPGAMSLIPTNGIINALLPVGGSPMAGFALIRADSQLDVAFGAGVATRQANIRSIVAPALPTPGGGMFAAAGAYHLECDTAGVIVAYINNLGNVGVTSSGAVGALGAAFLDANRAITLVPSNRSSKKNIGDLPSTAWFYKLQPRTFEYIKGPKDFPRHGFVLEEVEEAGAPAAAFAYAQSGRNDGEVDMQKRTGIIWECITTALVREMQLMRTELDKLKVRVAEFDAE